MHASLVVSKGLIEQEKVHDKTPLRCTAVNWNSFWCGEWLL